MCQRIFPQDQIAVAVACQQFAGQIGIHARFFRDHGQHAGIADIQPLFEIGAEQLFHDFVLETGGTGPADQAMGIDGVGPHLDLFEIEGDAFAAAGLAQRIAHRKGLRRGAEFALHIGAALGSFRRYGGVKLIGAPVHLERNVRAHGQRLFQAAFADEAPRANGIGYDVELHGQKPIPESCSGKSGK